MTVSSALPVVAGTDASAAGLAAARAAAAQAVLHQRPLHLVAAYATGSAGSGAAPAADLTAAQRALAAATDQLGPHGTLVATSETAPGQLAEVLIERTRAAHIVVVPADTVPEPAPPTSPPATLVAAHAACPVIVVPTVTGTAAGPVLLAVDDEAELPAVTEFAFAEASARGVALRIVHVWPALPDAALGTLDPFAYRSAAADDEADRLLAEAVAGWGAKYPDVTVQRRAVHDPDIVQALIRQTAGSGLLVVGARHHPLASDQLLGPVTRALIGRTHCPLAVVPARRG
jgi:nucleotide-binding universal stress UspA family protein